ncbi:AsnC family transcriptional regulator [Kordiimonas sediminis]|uniref:AsnC family transcriptional regulator n=1 Tax=Kordiimonas sediminis TaxID=1735581 RepID=A0A919E6E4_9PROT|nr:Lrp/AsnC ligand binding domain-containing protein [Kordiimonas sediminis]GHF23944.1 AsnC family transcriptional regulator [Kordiimonas sediminis]
MKDSRLDKIDRRILTELQNDGRISNVELASRVGLSPTPCLERVKRLEKAKYIQGYTARLDGSKLNLNLIAFIEVSLDKTSVDAFDRFHEAVKRIPEIQECHMVAGGFDYLMKVRVRNMPAYRKFLASRLAVLPGVDRTRTYVVMEEVKDSQSLVIPDL